MAPRILPDIEAKLLELRALCRRHHVLRLDLIGSAVSGSFDPARSDLDFVLEFQPEAKAKYPEVYFDLRDDLEALFGRKVDLVMLRAVKNPVFLQEIEDARATLYAA